MSIPPVPRPRPARPALRRGDRPRPGVHPRRSRPDRQPRSAFIQRRRSRSRRSATSPRSSSSPARRPPTRTSGRSAPTACGLSLRADGRRYKTRIVVFRPERAEFNGTVIVEWLNVSGGVDAAPDWIAAHTRAPPRRLRLRRRVRAVRRRRGRSRPRQRHQPAAQAGEPARYGSLSASRRLVLVRHLLAAAAAVRGARPGHSRLRSRQSSRRATQSAFRMVTYVNGIHR
jgi:hypothetical protein